MGVWITTGRARPARSCSRPGPRPRLQSTGDPAGCPGYLPLHHLITDANGLPLDVILTGGNRNDVTQLLPVIDAIPPVRGRRG